MINRTEQGTDYSVLVGDLNMPKVGRIRLRSTNKEHNGDRSLSGGRGQFI